ncbi:Beta-glucan synthesis-associated protein KRE6 [Termitomyces sp. T112]|nr:Beta-glucan synthesis-associated protein KRE6 [Termitomyces sp. T112]
MLLRSPQPKYNRFTASSAASSTSLLSNNDGIQSQSAQSAFLSEKYSFSPSPAQWGIPLDTPEDDDELHNPSSDRDTLNDRGGLFSLRGLTNVGFIALLTIGILALFAGYPIISHFMTNVQTTQGGFNLGGINATGQVAEMPGNWGLIDLETPQEAHTKADYMNGEDWVLVFSDEFNTDGRTFYPGDDPYWEAVDLHYWQTNDLEWYDPSGATTKDGYLQLRLEVAIPEDNHNMSYKSGMIQTWNKFCFTGGLIEANVSLPGDSTVSGLWPAIWTMGNLGRAGYGASLEGMWPYSYDSCDVGTLPNQTYPGTQTPLAAVENGDPANNNELSYLPGQRLSACTCSGESHPGPVRANGTYVGRAAPEIDVYEALVTNQRGQVSQSAQWAPFNAQYDWFNTTDNLIIPNPDITVLNPYKGGAFQQTTSGLSFTNRDCYEGGTGCFSVYGFQYQPGFDNAYITWINNNEIAWTIMQAGLAQDPLTEIGPRPIPQEPIYIIANLGFSLNFGDIDFANIQLPATMRVDWIRVYQPANTKNIGCDPSNFPTAAYINAYMEAYTNANLTTWRDDFHQEWPKNKLMPGGC